MGLGVEVGYTVLYPADPFLKPTTSEKVITTCQTRSIDDSGTYRFFHFGTGVICRLTGMFMVSTRISTKKRSSSFTASTELLLTVLQPIMLNHEDMLLKILYVLIA
jgi:hypothetical protein